MTGVAERAQAVAGMAGDPAPSAPRETVIGLVAHARSVPSLRREAFAAELAAMGDGPGHVVVHTCHRVEVYIAPATFRGILPALPAGGERLEDVGAVRHLISVACGLDSSVLGEAQILHQLRETIAGRRGRSLDPVLDRLFQAALHAGRSARAWFTGSPRSLADVALDRIEAASGPIAGRQALVVGVGRMGRLAAFAAMRRRSSVVVTNRGAERAARLAHEVGGSTVPFGIDGSLAGVDDLAGVIVAITGPWPVGSTDVARLADRMVPVVDLSSPPAIPTDLGLTLGDRSLSIDELADDDPVLGQRARRRLEQLISETGRDYCAWLRTRDAVPAIQAVVSTAEQHRRDELERLRQRMPDLSTEELLAVEQMSHRLVASILHAPLTALNGDASGALERAARELFGV